MTIKVWTKFTNPERLNYVFAEGAETASLVVKDRCRTGANEQI
jgi:hypothetical protein